MRKLLLISLFIGTSEQGSSNRGMSPALLETGDSVPRSSVTHRQYFHPRSLICYLDLSELTFSQSQGESSLGRVFHELHLPLLSRFHSFTSFFSPQKKTEDDYVLFFFSQTHSKYVLCRDDTIHAIKFPCYDLTYCNATSGLYSECIWD